MLFDAIENQDRNKERLLHNVDFHVLHEINKASSALHEIKINVKRHNNI
jgi:hypothetical protein